MNIIRYLSILLLPFLTGCDWGCCTHKDHAHEHATKSSQKTADAPQHAHITALTSKEIFQEKVIAAGIPALVDFYAPWCSACTAMEPVFTQLAEKHHASYQFFKLNVDEVEAIAQEYDVKGIPAFLFFKDGKVADKIIGVANEQAFENKMNAVWGK